MRRLAFLTVVLLAPLSSASADLAVFGTAMDGRSQPGFGAGARVSVPLHPHVELEARSAYIKGATARNVDERLRVRVVPLDFGGAINVINNDALKVYGTGGATYGLLNISGENTQDDWGWYAGGGALLGQVQGIGLFTEVLYRDLHSRFRRDGEKVPFKMDGVSANVGVAYRW